MEGDEDQDCGGESCKAVFRGFFAFVDRRLHDLPGTGRPLPKPTGNDAATDWVLREVRKGGHDTKALLPPALALKREVQDLPETLAAERTEARVREVVTDLNERIRQAYLNHHTGPPLTVALVDVEEAVRDWRRSRTAS